MAKFTLPVNSIVKEGKVFNGQKHRTKQWLIKPTSADVDQIKNPIDIEKK